MPEGISRSEEIKIPHSEVDKKKLEVAYKQMMSERLLLIKMAKGDEELAQAVINDITERLVEGRLDVKYFIDQETNRAMRISIYKNITIDNFRRNTTKGLLLGSYQEYNLVDTDTTSEKYLILKEVCKNLEQDILLHPNLKDAKKKYLLALIVGVLQGKTKTEIARELDLTVGRILQIINDAKKKLPKHMLVWDVLSEKRSPKEKSEMTLRDIETLQLLHAEFAEKDNKNKEEEILHALLCWYVDKDFDILQLQSVTGKKNLKHIINKYNKIISRIAGRPIRTFSQISVLMGKGRIS